MNIVWCEKQSLTFCPKVLLPAYLFLSLSADNLGVYDDEEKHYMDKTERK